MKNNIKKIIKPYISPTNINLIRNYFKDYLLYRKYATIFDKGYIENKEANLILHYHGLEKGLLHNNLRLGFAKDRVNHLHHLLNTKKL